MKATTAQRIKPGFRPILSATYAPMRAPAKQPACRVETMFELRLAAAVLLRFSIPYFLFRGYQHARSRDGGIFGCRRTS